MLWPLERRDLSPLCDNNGMFAVILTLSLQSTSIQGTLQIPPGSTSPPSARVVLLPLEYAKLFNALAQRRIDNYWGVFLDSGMARRNKELFTEYLPVAYSSVLEDVVSEMRRDGINTANLIKTAPQGNFEFTNITPGEYKIVATAVLRGEDRIWTETVQVVSSPLVIQLKHRP